MPRLYNLNSHKLLRRELRRNATPAERRFWSYVKNRQVQGFFFRRQHSIDRYIVDFYCPQLRLVVEIDGLVHQDYETQHNDKVRQQFLEACFIRVIRFTNKEVMENIEEVLKVLETYTISNPPHDSIE